MNKVTSADVVAALIEDGATIAISGTGGGMVEADYLLAAIEKRFLETGHPRDLTLIHSLGIGDRDSKGSNRFAHAGMLKRIIAAFYLVAKNAGSGKKRRDRSLLLSRRRDSGAAA